MKPTTFVAARRPGRGGLLAALLVLVCALPAFAKPAPNRPARRARPVPAERAIPAPPATAPGAPAPKRPPQTGLDIEAAEPVPFAPLGRRVEFDALTIMGQSKASGAVYLFERQFTDLPSLIRRRENYRPELERLLKERGRP